MEAPQKRQIAYKLRIKDILEGQYFEQEGWQPNYLLTKKKQQVSRVNLFGTVVARPEPSIFILDDGTGQISVRLFEPVKNDQPNPGQPVLIIGRLRQFNSEKYVVPEIIKKLSNPLWIELRKKEFKEIQDQPAVSENPIQSKKETEAPYEYLVNIIKKLDQGEGVDVDAIIKKSTLPNTEEFINSLIREGEIFEIKPGTVKLLK